MATTPTSPTTSPVFSSNSPLPSNTTHQTQQQPPENIFRAVHPYIPRHDGEIGLQPGDIITNTKDLGNGWSLGQNVSADTLGIFPSDRIQPLSVANAALQDVILAHGSLSLSVDLGEGLPSHSLNGSQQQVSAHHPSSLSASSRSEEREITSKPPPQPLPGDHHHHHNSSSSRLVNYNPQLGTFSSPNELHHHQQQPVKEGLGGVGPPTTAPPLHHHTSSSPAVAENNNSNNHYVQVAQQCTNNGRVITTNSLLTRDRAREGEGSGSSTGDRQVYTTAPHTEGSHTLPTDQSYEVLRPGCHDYQDTPSSTTPLSHHLHHHQQHQRSMNNNHHKHTTNSPNVRDVELNFSKQKESPRLSSFKPPPPPSQLDQNHCYSREHSLDSDLGDLHNSSSFGNKSNSGGGFVNEITTSGDQLRTRGVNNIKEPLTFGEENSGCNDCNNATEDITTAKGKSSRRLSPKRVRLALVDKEGRAHHHPKSPPPAIRIQGKNNPGATVAVTHKNQGGNPAAHNQQQLANVINKPIEHQQGERISKSRGSCESQEYNQQKKDRSLAYPSPNSSTTQESSISLNSPAAAEGKLAADISLPSPIKRGRFTPPPQQQKPQLAVKPNHLCSVDNMEGGDRGHMTPEEVGTDLQQQQQSPKVIPPSPTRARRVKSSPRSQQRSQHLQQQHRGQMDNTTPITARVMEPTQLHNAPATPGTCSNGCSASVTELKKFKGNVRRMADEEEEHADDIGSNGVGVGGSVGSNGVRTVSSAGHHKTTPAARAVIVMPSQQQHPCHQYTTDCSSSHDCSMSSIYPSHDTTTTAMLDSVPHCNSLLYDDHDDDTTQSQRDNFTNESLTRRGDSRSLPPAALRRDKEHYYGDYRSLDDGCCDGGSQTMDKSARFRSSSNHHNSHPRYKPILKHQRVADSSKGQQHHHNPNQQRVYYHQEEEGPRGGQDPVIRIILSVVSGLVVGFLLFCWMYFCLGYSLIVALSVSVAVATLAIIALALSRLIRCVAALALPSLCTTRGRLAYLMLVTGFLIAGPVNNVYRNMHEVSRSMGCSAEQAFNQSMLLLEPFDTMMQQLETTVAKLEYAAWEVDRGLRPLDAGLTKVDRNLAKGKLFLTYTSEACTGMIETAYSQCTDGIAAAQEKCLGVITDLGTVYIQAKDVLDRINPERWAPKQQHLFKRQIIVGGTSATATEAELTEDDTDICEALDMNQVCESLNQTELLCKPSMWAGDAIQEAINATQKAMSRLRKQLQFNVKSDPFSMARVNASRVVFHIRQAVLNQFESRTRYFEHAVSALVKVIPVALLLLLYAAYLHVKRYMSRDGYDNRYVTKTFWALDQKRAEVAGSHLFPLKQYERRYLVDATVSDLSPQEEGLYKIGLCVFFLHLLLSFVCYVFDFVLFWILALIRQHGNPPDDVTGQAALENVLEGEGVIVELLDIFLIGFHRGNSYGFDRGENQCLPYPHTPSLAYLVVVAVFYLILLLTILLKAYLLRLRNSVTGFFYPERRKQRTVHLYNVVLGRRSRLPKILQTRARMVHREQRQRAEISMCHKVAAKCAPCRVFLYRSAQCLVCSATEDHTFRDCETEKCTGVYCAPCYSDLGRVCPLCLHGTDYEEEEEGEGENYEEMEEEELEPCHRSSQIYL